jgi:hypothetical protein
MVYPNPASKSVTINRKQAAENWTITLIDGAGRVFRNWKLLQGEKSISADLSGISPGFYWLQINNGTASSAVSVAVVSAP